MVRPVLSRTWKMPSTGPASASCADHADSIGSVLPNAMSAGSAGPAHCLCRTAGLSATCRLSIDPFEARPRQLPTERSAATRPPSPVGLPRLRTQSDSELSGSKPPRYHEFDLIPNTPPPARSVPERRGEEESAFRASSPGFPAVAHSQRADSVKRGVRSRGERTGLGGPCPDGSWGAPR